MSKSNNIQNNGILQWQNIYFVGIGGIGMSALARYFHSLGKLVVGYDKTETELTKNLVSQGIEVHYNDAVSAIDKRCLNSENTLVVFTPAIPKEHKELNYFLDNGFKVIKRAEALGIITKDSFCLAVAGTHGKTTTSAILGHIMEFCGENATSFLGGISENYNSNLILGGSKTTVVEADEYDRSFLQLSPDIACITSVDADHLDIYGEKDALTKSFNEFAEKVSKQLIVREGIPIKGKTFGFEDGADYQIKNVKIENGDYVFDVKVGSEKVENIHFQLPGKHNLLNAVSALAIAFEYGIELKKIAQALETFKGVQRRFTYKIKQDDLVLIDDYAHHPTEIDAVLNSVREMYPNKDILTVFQPHLFSRTRDFIDEFAQSLSKTDSLILLDIYPARELPIEGVTSNWLLEKVTLRDKMLCTKANLEKELLQRKKQVVVMLGAGDIGALIEPLKNSLLNQLKKVS